MKKVLYKEKSVLFLCQYFYPEKVSSATLPTDTAVYLSENGFSVDCLCGYPIDDAKHNSTTQIAGDCCSVRIKRVKYAVRKKDSFFAKLINYFSFTFKCLLNLKKMRGYEYIVVYSNPPVLPYVAYRAHKKFGSKIIFVSYDVYPEIAINTRKLSSKSLLAFVMRKINVKLYHIVYKVVALSEDMKDFLLENRDLSKEKVAVVPNWFRSRELIVPTARRPFVVTYLGNMGTCQDIQTLLDAARVLSGDSSFKFIIGGQGNKAEYVRDFVEKNGLSNVQLYGFISGEEYDKVMTASHCFIVSLERNLSGLCFPSKYYSYLAYGRPIIAIMEESVLTKEILSYEIGFSIRNGDYVELAESIKRLNEISDAEYICTCGKAHELFNLKYTSDICNEKFRQLLS